MSRYSVKAWGAKGTIGSARVYEHLDDARRKARRLWRECAGERRVTVYDELGAVIMMDIPPDARVTVRDLPCHDPEHSIYDKRK